jgi:alpha-L-fucosidase
MDLNAAKYPREALFYTDIKSYEQGAGQKISTSENRLPALACLPLQSSWFWKTSFPTDQLKSPETLVREMIEPYGDAHCTFILNVAPNREGLMDQNALDALKEIGRLWTRTGHVADVPEAEAPIVSTNLAKNRPSRGSWSDDYAIYDFANDDDFNTCWNANREVETPWWSVQLGHEMPLNMVVITDRNADRLQRYRIEVEHGGRWVTVFEGAAPTTERVKIHRFPTTFGSQVRLTVLECKGTASIAEVGVYCEPR